MLHWRKRRISDGSLTGHLNCKWRASTPTVIERNFKSLRGVFALISVTLGIRCQLAYFDISLASGSNFCSLQ